MKRTFEAALGANREQQLQQQQQQTTSLMQQQMLQQQQQQMMWQQQQSIYALAQQLQQRCTALEQTRLELQQQQQPQAAVQPDVERPQPSLSSNEPMRVPIPATIPPTQVAVGTKSYSSDLPRTKPNSPVPTWAQLPTMDVLPSTMSEQLPTPSMRAMPPELPTAQVMPPELPTVHRMPAEAETVSEMTVGAADPNPLVAAAALGAQTLVAAARSMPQLPRDSMGQQPMPFLLTLPSLDTTAPFQLPAALEHREELVGPPPGLELEQQQPQEQEEQQPLGSVGALSEAVTTGNFVVISPSWDVLESSASLPESSPASTSSQRLAQRPHAWPAVYTPP